MNVKSKEYFPPKSNLLYIYRSSNNDLFTFKRYIDYFNENKIQVIFDNGINNIINIYEYANDGVKLSFQSNLPYHHENLLNNKNNENDYLIKDPIVKGNVWLLSNGNKRCITNVDVLVKTRFSVFKSAIEIVTTSKNNSDFSVDYYVLGIGLIKSICYIDKVGIISYELEDINENFSFIKPIKVYYPDNSLNTIWFYNNILEYNTNENITLSFYKLFKNPPKGLLPLIEKNIQINTIYYDYDNNFSYIDFSEDILNILNKNSAKANLFFHSIYNTLKDYYNTSKVYITINNHYYSNYFNITIPKNNAKFIEWRVYECNHPFTYVVNNNDTIVSISKKFDINYNKIIKINDIKNPNKLCKNQVIQLYSTGIYIIKPNDSLESIAEMFSLNINKLIEINNIYDSNLLHPGKKIKLF